MEIDKKTFILTPEEVEIVEESLNHRLRYLNEHKIICDEIGDPRTKAYSEVVIQHEELLTRIKQWQDGNKKG